MAAFALCRVIYNSVFFFSYPLHAFTGILPMIRVVVVFFVVVRFWYSNNMCALLPSLCHGHEKRLQVGIRRISCDVQHLAQQLKSFNNLITSVCAQLISYHAQFCDGGGGSVVLCALCSFSGEGRGCLFSKPVRLTVTNLFHTRDLSKNYCLVTNLKRLAQKIMF